MRRKTVLKWVAMGCLSAFVWLFSAVQANTPVDPFRVHANSTKHTKHAWRSQLFRLHYAQASKLARVISQTGLVVSRNVSSDPRTNALWVRAEASQFEALKQLIHELDRPITQVFIKACIVSVDADELSELGLQFRSKNRGSESTEGGLMMDVPAMASKTGQFNFAVTQLGDKHLLDVQISALASEGRAKIISSPELVTANHQAAYIAAGAKVPFQEKTGHGNTSVTFKKAVLSLKVTPQILQDDQLLLDLEVNQDAVSSLEVQGVPAINTQQIKTKALIQGKKTLVLGGIYEQSHTQRVQKIPVLSAIPGLGYLFQHHTDRERRKALLIFVTPYIAETHGAHFPLWERGIQSF